MLAARRFRDIGCQFALVLLPALATRTGLAAGLPAQEFVPLSVEATYYFLGSPQLADNGRAVYNLNGQVITSDGILPTLVTTNQAPFYRTATPGISNDGTSHWHSLRLSPSKNLRIPIGERDCLHFARNSKTR